MEIIVSLNTHITNPKNTSDCPFGFIYRLFVLISKIKKSFYEFSCIDLLNHPGYLIIALGNYFSLYDDSYELSTSSFETTNKCIMNKRQTIEALIIQNVGKFFFMAVQSIQYV